MTFCNLSAPSSPPLDVLVTDITSTSLLLTWSPPATEDHNGVLEEYTILITSVTDYLDFFIEENSLIVDSLKPYTKYDIVVAASTHEGMGPFSEALTVQTEEDGKNLNIQISASQCKRYGSFYYMHFLNFEKRNYKAFTILSIKNRGIHSFEIMYQALFRPFWGGIFPTLLKSLKMLI